MQCVEQEGVKFWCMAGHTVLCGSIGESTPSELLQNIHS